LNRQQAGAAIGPLQDRPLGRDGAAGEPSVYMLDGLNIKKYKYQKYTTIS